MKHKLIFCSQKINKSHIRRETRRGVEHIILQSFTLPPDIVMNGGLYPSEEVDKSFLSLNRTPVTIEHPELDGQYVSANDPEIDFDFRFGAFNENATKGDDGRISVDKVINVQKAMKSDKGKRLLDRVNELETSEKPRPLHTSVGVFVDAEELDEPKVNADGQEFKWIARNMIFDHDAILLDSIGAATPDQGTGIGINAEEIKVEHFILDSTENSVQDNDDSHDPVLENNTQTNEGDAMRDEIIAKLESLGIKVNAEITDADLLVKYKEAELAANTGNDDADDKVEIEVNSDLAKEVKDQADKIETLEADLKANKDIAIAEKIKTIRANSKYKDLSENALKAIHANSEEDFDAMHSESITSFGIGSTTNIGTKDDGFTVNTIVDDLPE